MALENPQDRLRHAQADYDAFKSEGIQLNMTWGWPSPEQLDLSAELLSLPGPDDHTTASGRDARNYGGLQGLLELREIFAPIMGAPPEQIIAGNNSSLSLMHDTLVWALLKGVPGGRRPWVQDERRRFLCPVPGYYCHFDLTSTFGFELTSVPLTGSGPDMDLVERLVEDPAVKGMWAVPQYANPSGETYSDETVRRLANMKTGAPDFRIFWDDAYALHHLTPEPRRVANLLSASLEAGNPDRPFVFSSTSKVTFAGAGVAFFAGSPDNVEWYLANSKLRTIGPDKINHLRHARFLKSAENTKRLMEEHRQRLLPKFSTLDAALREHLGDEPEVSWTKPEGGYFTLLTVKPGTARRAVALAKEAGLTLSPAGSMHPHGVEPEDQLIRLAPTYSSVENLRAAAAGVAVCVRLAARELELKQA